MEKTFIYSENRQYVSLIEKMAVLYYEKNMHYQDSYRTAAAMIGRPVLEVLLARMVDKLARVCNIRDKVAMQESMVDNLIDLANYALIACCEIQKEVTDEREN